MELVKDKISVIMPTKNAQAFIKQAIESILAQSYNNFEFLIIDDNSTDRTREIIKSYNDSRVKLIDGDCKGIAAALNKGIDLAEGEFIARMDADDISSKNRFEAQINFLKQNPEISLVGSYQKHFGNSDWVHKPAIEPEILKTSLVFNCNICHSTLMFRKKDFIENNLYYPIDSLQEDFELWSKAIGCIKMATISEVLGFYRVVGEGISDAKGEELDKYQQNLAKNNVLKYFNLSLNDDELKLIATRESYYWQANISQKREYQRKIDKILSKIEKANNKTKFISKKNIREALTFTKEYICGTEALIKTKYTSIKTKPLETIFSIKNRDEFKILTVLGIKIKLQNYKKQIQNCKEEIKKNNTKNELLKKDLFYYMLKNTPQYGAEVLLNKHENYKIVCSAEAKNSDMLPLEYLINHNIDDFSESDCLADCYVLWGTKFWDKQYQCTKNANLFSKPLVVMEDGFLKSVASPWDKTADRKYRNNLSYTINSKNVYFDSSAQTELEKLMNDENLTITDEQKQRARACIDKIVSNHLTKYNHQPIFTPNIGREGYKKILVIDQSYGDMAISRANANDNTFKRMLECAIKENPEADIIVKTHPDTILGAAKGYFTGVKRHDNVYPYTEAINPVSLIKYCDEIYVCSSQMGFEALMCGKKVHNFGISFYSNYGLTNDRQACPRRKVKRTLEEAFYIIYIMFSYYISPVTKQQCEIEEIIDYIIKKRKEYFGEKDAVNATH